MHGRTEWMEKAIALAVENVPSERGGPFCAVIVRGKEIVAEAANLVTSTNDPTAHAEIVAIRAACKALNTFELSGCVIYSSCEPCPMCLAAIYWARMDGIFYGCTAADAAAARFYDDHLYDEMKLPVEKRSLPAVNLLRTPALAAFATWEQHEGRVDY